MKRKFCRSLLTNTFRIALITLLPSLATADVSTTGVFTVPTGTSVFTGVGTSNFSYGAGMPNPTRLIFDGVSRSGEIPTGRFTVGFVSMTNGEIQGGTGASSVELNIVATDTTSPRDQEEIIVDVSDGMVLRLSPDVIQQVDIRAQAFGGVGGCAVEGELSGVPYGFFAPPPGIWSGWIPIGPTFFPTGGVAPTATLTFRPVCDLDASAQVRYVPEARSASGIARLTFINTPNTDDPIASADSFCLTFDTGTRCAWVMENQSALFSLVGRLGSLEYVDLIPSPSDEGFVTEGTDPETNIIIAASMDVIPKSPRNVVNLNDDDEKKIKVAILTSSDAPVFSAHDVDVTSLRLGAGAVAKNPKFKDVDKDGDLDLHVKFSIAQSGIECGNTLVILTGETIDGVQFTATDDIVTRCEDEDEDEDEDDDDDEDDEDDDDDDDEAKRSGRDKWSD